MTRWLVGTLSDLPPGSTRRIVVGGAAVCLARVADGTVYAIGDVCTHEQESLAEGVIAGFEIECPGHFSRFDLQTGEVTAPPALEPARVFRVTIDGNTVFLDV